MPLVSILVIYSAKTHTLPSITFGLKRYSFPFSAVNSAIAHPCLATLTPSEEIALFVSFGVRTISSLLLYAPRVCLILVTSFPTFTASSRETDLVVPFLSVISTTLSSVRLAFTFSAPAVAVSHFLIASLVLPAAVLALSVAVSHSDLALEKSLSRFFSASTLASSANTRLPSALALALSLSSRTFSALALSASEPSIEEEASFTSSMAFLVSAIASSAFVMRFCKSTLGGRMTSAVSISTELSPSSVSPNSVSASALRATISN